MGGGAGYRMGLALQSRPLRLGEPPQQDPNEEDDGQRQCEGQDGQVAADSAVARSEAGNSGGGHRVGRGSYAVSSLPGCDEPPQERPVVGSLSAIMFRRASPPQDCQLSAPQYAPNRLP